MTGSGGTTDREPSRPFAARVRELAGLVAPTTVATALLVYFGAVYTDGRLAYYGIQLGLADLTNQDLVLYGTEAIYVPFAGLLLTVLLALAIHTAVTALLTGPQRRGAGLTVAAVLGAAGLLVTARAVIGIVIPGVSRAEPLGLTPLALSVGPVLLMYGGWLAGRAVTSGPDGPVRRWHADEQAVRVRRGAALAATGLALAGMFWATNQFAFALGLSRSFQEAKDPSAAYRVVLDTRERLAALPDGVTETPLSTEPECAFRYRYQGFRLVLESGDRLFLVPETWTRDSRTVVLRYDGSVRVQLIAPPKNLQVE